MSHWVQYEKNGERFWKKVGLTTEDVKYGITIALACFVMAVVMSVL